MAEIEELATKQGEEEARRLKQDGERKVVIVDNLSQNERKYNLKKNYIFRIIYDPYWLQYYNIILHILYMLVVFYVYCLYIHKQYYCII